MVLLSIRPLSVEELEGETPLLFAGPFRTPIEALEYIEDAVVTSTPELTLSCTEDEDDPVLLTLRFRWLHGQDDLKEP